MAHHLLPETPFLALDLAAFDRNVADICRVIVRDGGKRWRPHTKAIRSPVLAGRLIAAGASGVTCASVSEAEIMVAAGIDDVLIANQIVGTGQLKRLTVLNRTARVITAIDALVHIELLAAAAAQAGVVLPVVVELDVGLKRAGVASAQDAAALAKIVLGNSHLRFCGLMAWEGHVTRIADSAERVLAIRESVQLLTGCSHHCQAAGIPVEIVSCGGTGTYPVSSRIDGVTEIQAGGGVFGDLRYCTEFKIPLLPALRLCARVTSRPGPRRLVCNAGWKYHGFHPTPSQPVGLPPVLRVAWAAEHVSFDCASDIQGFAVGDPLEMTIGYADATVFLHLKMLAMRAGEIEEVLVLPAHP